MATPMQSKYRGLCQCGASFPRGASTEVIEARKAAGMTQSEAAQAVRGTMRAWQEWEAGNRRMHPGLWELFRIKLDMAFEDQCRDACGPGL